MIYEIENLEDARSFLAQTNDKIILTNSRASARYYGMRVLDCIFKKLQQEFPDKIERIQINPKSDYCALVTSKKLGY